MKYEPYWRKRSVFRASIALLAILFFALPSPSTVAADGSTTNAPSAANVVGSPQVLIPAPVPEPQPAAPNAGRNMNLLDDKQELAVGDTVSFRVVEDRKDPDDTAALTVTDAGELDVPELGLVQAKGKTCKQLAFEIKSKLEQVTYYHATVIMGLQLLNKTTSGRRVFVAGQVRTPGPQEIPAGETWTVSKAILAAGGLTDVADKKNVRLVRSAIKGTPQKTLIVNLVEIWEKGHTELDQPVEAEDLIYVGTRAVNFN